MLILPASLRENLLYWKKPICCRPFLAPTLLLPPPPVLVFLICVQKVTACHCNLTKVRRRQNKRGPFPIYFLRSKALLCRNSRADYIFENWARTFKEPKNRFQGTNSYLAGRYDNPIPTRFLAPIDCFKIPALAGRYDNPIPTRFLAPIDCSKIPSLAGRYDNPIPTRFLASHRLSKNSSIECRVLSCTGCMQWHIQSPKEPKNLFQGTNSARRV